MIRCFILDKGGSDAKDNPPANPGYQSGILDI